FVSTRYAIRSRSVTRLAHAIFVRHAVRDVVAIGPHAESGVFADGFWTAARLLVRNLHLDSGAFGELHVFQWLEDAVFVFRGNRHGWGFPICIVLVGLGTAFSRQCPKGLSTLRSRK